MTKRIETEITLCEKFSKCIKDGEYHDGLKNVEIFSSNMYDFYLMLVVIAAGFPNLKNKYVDVVRDKLKSEASNEYGQINLDDTVKNDYLRKFCKSKCGFDKLVSKGEINSTMDVLANNVLNFLRDVYKVKDDIQSGITSKSPDKESICGGTNYSELVTEFPDIHSKFLKSAEECTKDLGCDDQKKCIGDVFNCGSEQFLSMTTDKKANEHSIVSKFPQLGSCEPKDSGTAFSKNLTCLAGPPTYKWFDDLDPNENKNMCILVDDFNDPIKDQNNNEIKVPISDYSIRRIGSVSNQVKEAASDAVCDFEVLETTKCRKIPVETIHVNPGAPSEEPIIERCCSERYVAVKQIECEEIKNQKRKEEGLESTFMCEKRSAYSKLYGNPIKFNRDRDPSLSIDSCFCQKINTAKRQGMTNQFQTNLVENGNYSTGGGTIWRGNGTFVSKCWRASFIVALSLLFMVLYLKVLS